MIACYEEPRLIKDLRVIPSLLDQAHGNRTSNARDVWVAGIKNIKDQRTNLDPIVEIVGEGAALS